MKSINHQRFDQPTHYAAYVKTVPSIVAGRRLMNGDVVDFVLQSREGTFPDPDHDVIMVYSREEDEFLRRANRKLFTDGLLVPYQEQEQKPDYAHILAGGQKAAGAFVAEQSNPDVLKEFLTAAGETPPRWLVTMVTKRLQELER